MKKLLILFLFLPSISFASTIYDERVKKDCKNLDKMEEMSQKEINRCFKSVIIRNERELQVNIANTEQLYDALSN